MILTLSLKKEESGVRENVQAEQFYCMSKQRRSRKNEAMKEHSMTTSLEVNGTEKC